MVLDTGESESGSHSRVLLFAIPWTVACQAPLSTEFSRQEYCNGFPFPSPGDLPDLGIEPRFLALQADSLPSEPQGSPINAIKHNQTLRPLAELDGKPVFGENKESGEESRWFSTVSGITSEAKSCPTQHIPFSRRSHLLCHIKTWVQRPNHFSSMQDNCEDWI